MLTREVLLAALLLGGCGGGDRAAAPAPKPSAPDPCATAPAPAGERLSMVVLVQGDEVWMGSQLYHVPGDEMVGAFPGLPDALDALASGLPAGSRVALVTYGSEVTIRHPLGEVGGLARAIGKQEEYEGKIGVDLIAGLRRAHELLVGAGCDRKALVVMGDGTNVTAHFQDELDAEIQKLQSAAVAVFAIRYATELTAGEPEPRRTMERLGFSGFYDTGTFETFKSHVADVLARLRTPRPR